MVRKVCVVIPVFQNEGSIGAVVDGVAGALDRHADAVSYAFVLVNDGSTDGSWAAMREIQRRRPSNVTLVDLTRNFGQMSALLAGYNHAKGDCVVSMAADLQDPPEDVWKLVEAWLGGEKLVVASRTNRDDSWAGDLIAKFGWSLMRRFAIPNLPEGSFDFFLMDGDIHRYFVRETDHHILLQGRLLFYGAKPFQVPSERRRRPQGKSQNRLATKLKFFIDGFVAHSYLPLRIISLAGILLFIGAIAISLAITWYVVVHGRTVEGWASLFILVLMLSGLQFLAIGVIGEYLWRGIEQVRGRPQFIVRTVSGDAGEKT
jgi:polyisoprenyl-phosphate glycosyltransferase